MLLQEATRPQTVHATLVRRVLTQGRVRFVSQENTRLIVATRCAQIVYQISILKQWEQQAMCAKRVLRIRNLQLEVVLKPVVRAMLAHKVLTEACVRSVLRENTRSAVVTHCAQSVQQINTPRQWVQ